MKLDNWRDTAALVVDAHHGGPDLIVKTVEALVGVAQSSTGVELSEYPSKE